MSNRLNIKNDYAKSSLSTTRTKRRKSNGGNNLRLAILSTSTLFVGISLYPMLNHADADNVIDNINKISSLTNVNLNDTLFAARPAMNSRYIISEDNKKSKELDIDLNEKVYVESLSRAQTDVSPNEPVDLVVASLEPLPDSQVATASAPQETPATSELNGNDDLNVSIKVERGDTLSSLFEAVGLSGRLAFGIAKKKTNKALSRLRVGDVLHFTVDSNHELKELKLQLSPLDSLVISKSEGEGFVTTTEQADIEWRNRIIAGTINGSFSGAAQKAGLSGLQISELAGVYKWDMDFGLDVRKGDKFIVVLQEGYVGDQRINNKSKILAAEYDGAVVGRLTAIRFEHDNGEVSFYTPEGKGFQKAFLRAPLNYRRISSSFQPKRYHPILKKWRSHKGTDFAAGRGEKVNSTAGGKIIFIGRKGGYGKTIIVKHQDNITTLYSHLDRYKSGLKRGDRIRQGELIGYVGSTGLATGPHLHYEFRVGNKQVDAMKVPLPRVSPIKGEALSQFKEKTSILLPQIAQLRSRDNTTLVAANESGGTTNQ